MKIQQSPNPSAAAGEAARRAFPGVRPAAPAGTRFVRAAGGAPVAFASVRGAAARLVTPEFAGASGREVRA
ncbi:hypothetical protein G3I59_08145 [Amycolatopsis rubida]|uniref:Uncharacterized protein n=1 Tax=Amycolatopsis rubida TaxID=112413 RepID=A0ABX0BRT3_9PSEU|nr:MULTISPECIES: hypothetical protein [Amycolatopsis]MYW90590.1 hypothetical protein [Amycolatopsis rubida]NEC55571.1 hypothetical protein [Amycolatopsis rubida]